MYVFCLFFVGYLPTTLSLADPFWMISKHDYCGKVDLPPYKPRVDIASTVMLKSVQVLMRHGARTDFGPAGCFAQNKQPQYTCENSSLFSLESVKAKDLTEMPGFHFLSKVYDGSSCSVGQLLDEGIVQLKKVGQYLKSTYISQFACENEGRVNFYSTDTQRTMASLNTVISALYPSRQTKTYKVHTREFESDFFAMHNPKCVFFKTNRALFRTSKMYTDFLRTVKFKKCEQQWISTFQTRLDLWNAADCLLAPTCAKVSLPVNQVVPPSLFECVMDLTTEVRAEEYGGLPSSSYFATGRTLCDINSFKILQEIAKSANTQVAGLYALHDESIVCLLSSLGIWDIRWPKYAALIALEFYSDGSVRVLRDGLELAILRRGWEEVVKIKSDQQWHNVCNEGL